MSYFFILGHSRYIIYLSIPQKDLDQLTHFSTFFLQIGVIIVDKLNQIVQSFILRMILLMSGLILWEIRPRRSDSSDLYTYNNIQYHKIQLKISSCKSLCTILKIENKR